MVAENKNSLLKALSNNKELSSLIMGTIYVKPNKKLERAVLKYLRKIDYATKKAGKSKLYFKDNLYYVN